MLVRWDEIRVGQEDKLEEIFALYDQSFPYDVREPHEILLCGLEYPKFNAPNQFHLLAGYVGDRLLAFAAFHYLAEVNTGFIVYLATSPESRGLGIGTKALEKIEAILESDALQAGNAALATIVLETEQPEFVFTKWEKEDCIKRNRFYERNGYVKRKEIPYLQPPLHKGEEGIPLVLCVKTLRNIEMTPEKMRAIIESIYHEKYDLVNGISKQVLQNCLEKMKSKRIKREVFTNE